MPYGGFPDHIIAIPLRRQPRTTVGHLAENDLARILAQPDARTRDGRRHAVLLRVLYDTGARVQDLIDISLGDLRLESPAQVRLFGKGRKMRPVPQMEATTRLLRDHLREFGLDRPEPLEQPLFQNRQGARPSRGACGTSWTSTFRRCATLTRRSPGRSLPTRFGIPRGMRLLQAGVSLEIIRDFLGHEHVVATRIYARANLEMKRKALAGVAEEDSTSPDIPSWKKEGSPLEWLRSL